MAYYLIKDSTLTNIGNVIREKTGGTNFMTPSEMVTAIRSINANNNSGDDTSGDSGEAPIKFISEQAHVDSTSQSTFVTLLTNNSFIAENYNNANLFVALIANNLDEIDSNTYSSCYQWTAMFSSNKMMTANVDDIWYGMGIYLMLGKSYAYPSTLQIPYSLNDTSNTNYSYLNVTSNGDIKVYICNYDVLASGDYIVVAGLF